MIVKQSVTQRNVLLWVVIAIKVILNVFFRPIVPGFEGKFESRHLAIFLQF